MPGGQRVLVVGPLEGPRWRSITGVSDTLADELGRAGTQVATASAPWWNPPSLLNGVRARWWRQPGVHGARNGEFDVVHLTDHALGHHAGGFAGRARVVVTCHDVMPFTLPGYHRTARERVVKQAFLRHSLAGLRRADRVMAVSEFTAREATRLFDLPPHLVTVVPNMVRRVFRPLEQAAAEAALATAGLVVPSGPRVLSVGHAGPYKNLAFLIRVMAQPGLREATLIRVGRLTEQERALATNLGVAERIVYAGGVSDEVLTALYGAADVLAQPSRAEGFGLPVIEAMACGLPVVVSDGGALPEVAGDAGIVVPLGGEATVERFAEAMEALIFDTALRERVRQQGLARASLFRPELVVPRILSVYEDADR